MATAGIGNSSSLFLLNQLKRSINGRSVPLISSPYWLVPGTVKRFLAARVKASTSTALVVTGSCEFLNLLIILVSLCFGMCEFPVIETLNLHTFIVCLSVYLNTSSLYFVDGVSRAPAFENLRCGIHGR